MKLFNFRKDRPESENTPEANVPPELKPYYPAERPGWRRWLAPDRVAIVVIIALLIALGIYWAVSTSGGDNSNHAKNPAPQGQQSPQANKPAKPSPSTGTPSGGSTNNQPTPKHSSSLPDTGPGPNPW